MDCPRFAHQCLFNIAHNCSQLLTICESYIACNILRRQAWYHDLPSKRPFGAEGLVGARHWSHSAPLFHLYYSQEKQIYKDRAGRGI